MNSNPERRRDKRTPQSGPVEITFEEPTPVTIQANLIEIPLMAMDRTLLGYMGLTKGQAIHNISQLLDRCRMVGGVFTILWHNDSFLDPFYRDVYLGLLEILTDIENYDWQTEHDPLFN